MAVESDRSITNILAGIAEHVDTIVRAQFRLARVELRDEIRRLERASMLLAVGLVVATLAAAFILLAVVYALSTVMTLSAAALLVGVVTAACAIALATAGWKRLNGITLQKTATTLQENFQWTKTRVR